jgi:hypothetical protein
VIEIEGMSCPNTILSSIYGGRLPSGSCRMMSIFLDELPHTATSKILKTKLRAGFKDYKLPTAKSIDS